MKLISDYDIIALTETWLNEDISSSELGLYNYNVIRCDRSIFTSTKSTGGGVLLAIKKCFNYSVIPITDNSFEMLIVKVMVPNNIFLFGVVYVPTGSILKYYSDMINCFQTSICGFINDGYKRPMVDDYSVAHEFHQNHNIRDAAYLLSNWCELYVLKQCCDFQNISGNILDLLFTNFVDVKIVNCTDPIFECDSSHVPSLTKKTPNIGS